MALSPTSSRPSGGATQTFIRVTLRHSADPTNIGGSAPVVTPTSGPRVSSALTLPLLAFDNNGQVNVTVANDTGASVSVSGSLIVVNATGLIWLEQDTPGLQTVATGAVANVDFSAAGGGAGAGLTWNSTDKQIDIASAGVYAAFVTLFAVPA